MKPFRQPGWWQLQPIRATAGKKYNHSISGKLRYPHMPAKGLSGSIDQGLNYFVWGLAAPNKKFSLSCDQPQTLVGDIFIGIPLVSYEVTKTQGPRVHGRWISNINSNRQAARDGDLDFGSFFIG